MINANAIGTFFQRKKGKGSGPLPPIPGLDGVIGLYIAKGLTNDSMKENPVWKDKSGQGNDLQMKNFSWSLGSGCGLYSINMPADLLVDQPFGTLHFTTSTSYNYTVRFAEASPITIRFKISRLTEGVNKGLYIRANIAGSGTVDTKAYNTNGIHEYHYENENAFSVIFYNGGGNESNFSDFYIEIIPDYLGAIVFDGINDYGICETFPIVTKEKGYTVMALRKWLTYPLAASATLISKRKNDSLGAFTIERNVSVSEPEVSYTFGKRNGISIDNNDLVIWQNTNYYNGQELQVGPSEDTDTLLLGAEFYSNGRVTGYGNAAVYSLVIIDHDTTAEERQLVLDYWKQEYPHLFFDQAWTVTGLTNDSPNNNKVNNLVKTGVTWSLSNFAFAGNSGYGLYAQNYLQKWVNSESRVICTKTSDMYNITSIKGVQVHIYYQSISSEAPFTVPSCKVKITGLTDNQSITYANSGTTITTINSDGVYELPSFEFAAAGTYYGFIFSKPQESCDITIEQIPDYEGYLVLDGINDYIATAKFYLGDNFTIVGEWRFLDTSTSDNAGITKVRKLYLYNTDSGMRVYLNELSGGNSVPLKTLKAICSDGRVYDENWNEIQLSVIGTNPSSTEQLFIGSNTSYNVFTPMAIKNLAFYSSDLLTKEQCIAGYNLLQTFKNS